MTPFAIFYTTRFILQKPADRKLKDLLLPNFLLLISTSTGCFFSYLFFLFSIALFQFFRFLKATKISLFRLFSKFAVGATSLVFFVWFLNKDLIRHGFLKLFYTGMTVHHTVQGRWAGIVDYWNIFLKNPILGIGLGSGPFYLAQNLHEGPVDIFDPMIFNYFSPMNVTTEILAGLGLIGLTMFAYFFYLLFKTFKKALGIKNLTEQDRITLIAFGLSLFVVFFTLQFSQSIMRPYMWVHVGMFVGYAKHLKDGSSGKLVPFYRETLLDP